MDNPSRSERSRNAALQAALTIIARDGPARLTLDAIAHESGMSKGAVTHHFRSKEAVLKALLERQSAYFEDFSRRHVATTGAKASQPELAAQIATMREAIEEPHSVVFAILAALAENPGLLAGPRAFPGTGIQANLADKAKKLGIPVWKFGEGGA
jgi:AcrR family transcriptional regulator